MLTTTKNTLLNKALRLELAIQEARTEIDNETNRLAIAGEFKEASVHSYIYQIINDNITSIKKQLQKL